MNEMVKDSLYQTKITIDSGYLGTEVKCTINGEFELIDKENRKIRYNVEADTTYVNMVWNQKNLQ